jgi:hypothetical protein
MMLYGYSLSLTFLALFLVSFAVHAVSGAHLDTADRAAHGQTVQTVLEFTSSGQLWFRGDAELAKRVPGRLQHRHALHFPAPERLARIEAAGDGA